MAFDKQLPCETGGASEAAFGSGSQRLDYTEDEMREFKNTPAGRAADATLSILGAIGGLGVMLGGLILPNVFFDSPWIAVPLSGLGLVAGIFMMAFAMERE